MTYRSLVSRCLSLHITGLAGGGENGLGGPFRRGTIAVLTGLRYPEWVGVLVLVAPAVYVGSDSPGWLRPLLRTPQMRCLGLWLVRSISTRGEAILRAARHDPSGITPEVLAGYQKPLQAENWDRALWKLALAGHGLGLEANFDISHCRET